MGTESPEQKFNRLRDYVQNLVLKAYPNPDRADCPRGRAMENLAKRAADFNDKVEAEPDYQHAIHCSPCYREFLEKREELRRLGTTDPKTMSRRTEKRLGRTLDRLDALMKSAMRETRGE